MAKDTYIAGKKAVDPEGADLPPEVAAAISDEAAEETEDAYLSKSAELIKAQKLAELEAENEALKQTRLDYEKLEQRLHETRKLVERLIAGGGTPSDVIGKALKADGEKVRRDVERRMLEHIRAAGGKVVITLQPGQTQALSQPVLVGANGKFRKIPRGVPVEVTTQEFECLLNARIESKVRQTDENGNQVVHEIDRHSYPFVIHDHALQVLESSAAAAGVRL